MGVQGEIYNILGLCLPAVAVVENKLYKVNGRTVCTDDTFKGKAEFEHGVPTIPLDLANPTLVIRLNGYIHDDEVRGANFDENALVGYVIANTGYEGSWATLPPASTIDALVPRLMAEINGKFGYLAKPEEIKVSLLFDRVQHGGTSAAQERLLRRFRSLIK